MHTIYDRTFSSSFVARSKAFLVIVGLCCLPSIGLIISGLASDQSRSSNTLLDTLLLGSCFWVASLTCLSSVLHYHYQKNIFVLITGFAVLYAGCFDLFHLLIINNVLQNTESAELNSLSWTLSRMISACLILIAISLTVWRQHNSRYQDQYKRLPMSTVDMYVLQSICISLTFGSMYWILTHSNTPQILFTDPIIKRPWALFTFSIWILNMTVAWSGYKQKRSTFSLMLVLSIVPHLFAQLHMGIGQIAAHPLAHSQALLLQLFAYSLLTGGIVRELMIVTQKTTTVSNSHINETPASINSNPMNHDHHNADDEQSLLPIGKPKNPLSIRLPIAAFIMAITITFGASFSFYFEAERIVLYEQAERLRSESHLLKPLLDDLYYQASSDIIFLSHTPQIESHIAATVAGDLAQQALAKQQLFQTFSEMLASKPFLLQIRYIGIADQGKEILKVFNNGWAIQSVPKSRLKAIESHTFFQDTLKINPGNIHYTEVHLMREHEKIVQPHHKVIQLGTPLFELESGEPFGILSITLDFGKFIQEMVKDNLANINFYLANQNGEFLYHPDPKKIFAATLGHHDYLYTEFPELSNVMDAKISEKSFPSLANKTHDTYSSYYQLISLETFGSQHPIQLLLQHDNNTTNQELQSFRNHSLILGGCLALIALALAIITTRKVVYPLTQMTDAVKRYEYSGKLENMPIRSVDEIGVLARCFHNLIKQMSDTRKYIDAITNSVPVLLSYVDLNGRYQFVNNHYETWFGAKAHQIQGSHIRDWIDHDAYQELLPHIEKVLSGYAVSFDMAMPSRTGEQRYIHTTYTPDFTKAGRTRGFFVSVEDITDNKLSEMQLKELSLRLEFALKAPGTGVWDYHLDTNELIWDQQMYKLYGINEHEFSGAVDAWENGLHPEDAERAKLLLTQSIETGQDFNTEFRVLWPDGQIRHIEAHATLIPDEQGKSIRMVGTNVDITEKKALADEREKALAAAKVSTELKSQFLASMSHEIRTPLNGVIGMLELILTSPLNEKQREYTRIASYSAESLLTIINDILDFSKIEAGKLELEMIDFDIAYELEELVYSLQHKAQDKNLTMTVMMQETPHSIVKGDPTRLQQILINLISNAIKFTEQGEIRIEADIMPITDDCLQFNCSIYDSGIGMSEAQVASIFESFTQVDASTTRQYGGTGLGLAIVKQLCQLMKGDISVTSQPYKGSCFSFGIQLAPGDASQLPVSKALEDKTTIRSDLFLETPIQSNILESSTQIRILLVEDNPVNQTLVLALLEDIGMHCDVTDNGRLALAQLQQAPVEYHLILMDCQMPELDGYQTSQQIRQGECGSQYQHIPIIAMTANAMKGDREKCLAAGMDDYISKPVDLNKLKQTLKHWLIGRDQAFDLKSFRSTVRAASSEHSETELLAWDQTAALKRLMGKKNQLIRLIKITLSTLPEIAEQLKKAIKASEYERCTQLTHSLKGTIGNLNAQPLHDICIDIETAIKTNNTAKLHTLSPNFDQAFTQLMNALHTYLTDATQDNEKTETPSAGNNLRISTEVLASIEQALLGLRQQLSAGDYIDPDHIELFQLSLANETINEGIRLLHNQLELLDIEGALSAITQLTQLLHQEMSDSTQSNSQNG